MQKAHDRGKDTRAPNDLSLTGGHSNLQRRLTQSSVSFCRRRRRAVVGPFGKHYCAHFK